ncbi:EamA family transporter [Paenibacillus thiaminolyticus]|uniref:EamA family transporter n=1 Tax=Paenibacillus thiaminolyticus TaxID=49283 RepID=A0AAP9DWU3_PANTH|nr:EamA family transporter [Paenibacillus thiaminolyticus]MCY9534368.1 EamA family transporter [Paenibacillus thiaminolyticus]MCY9602896.1 EamA family transporter [Paenibacillus thiaminolyticus]MCY9608310.1 EamA family transporter [Paenibacillus thiaminolyticus]MCY9614405.1 EamA family transporter [Paenibacillus thiaminolyticus]MCY9618194.1 EamA family transporter [Paenibacillus thiaminolyticus]
MWVIYAFGAALFAGITSILAKIGIQNTDSNLATALRTGIVVIFAWIIVFAGNIHHTLYDISLNSLVYLILSGMTTGASWIFYFRALQLGNVNVVVPIDKSSTVITMLFAIIMLGEPVTILKMISMATIGIGTYMMIQKQDVEQSADRSRKWIWYAGLSAFFAAITAILGKVGIEDVDSNLGTAIRTIVVLIMAWLIVFATKKQNGIKEIDKKSWIFITLSGLATGMSWLFYFKALQEGQASIVVPIDKLSIIVTIIFAYIVLKEKLSMKAFAGFILIILGTLLLLI